MRILALIVSGGALAAVAAVLVGYRKAAATREGVLAVVGGDAEKAQAAIEKARAATTPAEVRAAADEVRAAAEKMTGDAAIALRLTGYWPFAATDAERRLEGGVHDRKGRPLHTVEDFLAGRSDHVSLSGDDAAWPYGQKVIIPWTDGRTIVGRVTDTGGSFRGINKKYRVLGREPIDVCVASRSTKVPAEVTARIVRGDHLDKAGAAVAAAKFRGQEVVVGALHMLGAGSAG